MTRFLLWNTSSIGKGIPIQNSLDTHKYLRWMEGISNMLLPLTISTYRSRCLTAHPSIRACSVDRLNQVLEIKESAPVTVANTITRPGADYLSPPLLQASCLQCSKLAGSVTLFIVSFHIRLSDSDSQETEHWEGCRVHLLLWDGENFLKPSPHLLE